MKLIKQVVKKQVNGETKNYTNFILKVEVNGKHLQVAIEPKTFGRAWNHPQVREAFTILTLISELEIVDESK